MNEHGTGLLGAGDLEDDKELDLRSGVASEAALVRSLVATIRIAELLEQPINGNPYEKKDED